MEAENVSQLKYMLEMELDRLRDRTKIDLTLFLGLDGRIFSSSIPEELTSEQYTLLSIFKSNLPHLCGKLQGENLELSIEQWQEGMAIVAAVGENSFLSCLLANQFDIGKMDPLVEDIINSTEVLNHIFQQKPLTEEALEPYPEKVRDELEKLSRQLFVERFKHTRKYQKNMKILEFIENKLENTVGVGQVDEIVSVTFNELGTSAPYMDDDMWNKFLEKVIDEHLRDLVGDVQAEEYKRLWKMELKRRLKKYL